jgi:DNA-binding MarR family transcriptional regulator
MNDTAAEAQAGSLTKVLTALATLGEATAAAVAEQAGLGYSTTTPKLRALEDAEQAERSRNSDGRTLWRLTTAGRAAVEAAAHTDPDSDAEATGSAAAEPGQDTAAQAARAGGDDLPADSPSRETDASQPTQAGDANAVADPVIPADLGTATPDEGINPGEGGSEPGTPPASAGRVPASGPADQSAAERAGSAARRSGGTLRGAILDIFEAHPDQQYKVSELCRLIDKANEGTGAAKASAGAVANAVVKLVGAHRVIQTVERPATFQLAPGTD